MARSYLENYLRNALSRFNPLNLSLALIAREVSWELERQGREDKPLLEIAEEVLKNLEYSPGWTCQGLDEDTYKKAYQRFKMDVIQERLIQYVVNELELGNYICGCGFGESNEVPVLTIFLEKKIPKSRLQIPETFQGYPVKVEVTGKFVAA